VSRIDAQLRSDAWRIDPTRLEIIYKAIDHAGSCPTWPLDMLKEIVGCRSHPKTGSVSHVACRTVCDAMAPSLLRDARSAIKMSDSYAALSLLREIVLSEGPLSAEPPAPEEEAEPSQAPTAVPTEQQPVSAGLSRAGEDAEPLTEQQLRICREQGLDPATFLSARSFFNRMPRPETSQAALAGAGEPHLIPGAFRGRGYAAPSPDYGTDTTHGGFRRTR
jgi:hypothetical protein